MTRGKRQRHELANIEAFAHLSDGELSELESQLTLVTIKGGETLISAGEPSDAFYLVVSGRFHVVVPGVKEPVAEIGTGKSIGEIGFFSGSARTATVIASRDSLVLRLLREDFDSLCKRSPEIWPKIVAMMARRLVRIATEDTKREKPMPRTIAVCHAGAVPVPDIVVEKLKDVFCENCRCEFLTSSALHKKFPNADLSTDSEVTRWLNDQESQFDYLFFISDTDLSDWSALALRHADMVLTVGLRQAADATSPIPLNPLEEFAGSIHGPDSFRLILIHETNDPITGTRHWLDGRSVGMHHHVRIDSTADYKRLCRFVRGEAVGLVACGGGAYCAAHIGMFEAFLEAGLEFDIMGGTSGGAAMVGAFAMGISPEELDRRTHDIFVTNRAMRRATWPRYSLLDHKVFDERLAHHYGDVRIEDLRIPYFAISTDLSHDSMRCIRNGLVWKGIRSSSAIPGVLPPVFTEEGDILVDGSLLDNVPLRQMLELKAGPNVIINFDPPELTVSGLDYDSLPTRGQLIRKMLLPFLSPELPRAPSAGNILTRSLAVNRIDFRQFLTDDDLLFVPPLPTGMSILDWNRHSELRRLAYSYAMTEIARRRKAGHKLLR